MMTRGNPGTSRQYIDEASRLIGEIQMAGESDECR